MQSPLISAAELQSVVGAPDCVVVDCRFDLKSPHKGFQAYLDGHIPGARYAHLDKDLARTPSPAEGRHPLPAAADFQRCLATWGIRANDLVVAYDDAGGAIAARLWWMLRWVRHDRTCLLDGGLQAWESAGYPLECDLPVLETCERPIVASHDERWLKSDAVSAALRGGGVLLDARAAGRFDGEFEPIDAVAGHIPGAVNLPFTDLLDQHGRFLPESELRKLFEAKLDADDASNAIAMCGSGVTACHLLAGMEAAGLTVGRLYVGSWSEWIRDTHRPVAIGQS